MPSSSFTDAMGIPPDVIEYYERYGSLPGGYQTPNQQATQPSPIIGVDQRDTGGERTGTGSTTTSAAAPAGGFNPADWPDPYEESATRYNAATNAANPGGANPNLPFYEGTDPGGGYIRGIGQTLAPGRSVTAADAQRFIAEARAAGADDAYIRDFLARNPYDFSRLTNAWLDETTPMGDSNDPATAGRPLAPYSTSSGGGMQTSSMLAPGGTGTDTYNNIEPNQSQHWFDQGGLMMGGNDPLSSLLGILQGNLGTSQAHQAELKKILMEQLGLLDNPVSLTDPGIREAVAANRAGLQRGGEARRREMAERRAYDESGGMGSAGYQNDIDRIQQQQGEAGAQFEGQVLFQEMTQRREQLTGLLSQAMALGDAETARLIQAELQAINMQIQQSQFADTMGFNYFNAIQNANNAVMQWIYGGGNTTI